MDKALRRQLGAEQIDLDTDTGWAQFTLPEPVLIDYDALEEAADDASYTIVQLLLDISGRAQVARCEPCERDVTRLRIPETGQTFELVGAVPANASLRVKLSTEDWTGDHVRFEVLEVIPTADPRP